MTRTRTQTQTRTRTQTEAAPQPRVAGERELALDHSLSPLGLSAQEEQVLRMRRGVTLARDAALEFRGQEQPQLAAELAAIEARALQRMRPSQEQQIADEILGGLRRL